MNIENQDSKVAGAARSPGRSTADIITQDRSAPPPVLTASQYEFLGDHDLSYDSYTSQDVFDAEIEKLWPKVWQWACRLEHIPEVGDHYVYDVGPYSILVVRHGAGPDDIKAYHNSCLHRGTQLKASGSVGNTPALRCPFHGWEWNLDGTINEIPCRWDFPKVKDEDVNLPEVKVGLWGGFVFINMDPEAGPLDDYLEVLPDHFKGWPLEDRYVAIHVQKTLPANWKAAQDAFLEAYHVPETHAQLVSFCAGTNAQYDVFGDNVSRFVHTFGHADPLWGREQSEQDLLDASGMVPEGTVLPEGMSARECMAQFTRDALGADLGLDLSGYSDSEMLDSIEYHLFPNMFLFPGIGLPMIYRFRPNGMDKDTCIFDLLFLRMKAPGAEAPDAPEPHVLGINESYTQVPSMQGFLAPVYDQDTANLGMQQRGFYAGSAGPTGKNGQTLGNYQEIRIRRIHETLQAYLSA